MTSTTANGKFDGTGITFHNGKSSPLISNDIIWHDGDGNEMLRLNPEGFHHNGETIKDLGEAHRRFIAWFGCAGTP